MELMVRVDRALGTHLPANVMAEAETLDDVIAAMGGASGGDGSRRGERPRGTSSGAGAGADAGRKAGDALAEAETWQEVLRYRARTDAGRTHLILLGDGQDGDGAAHHLRGVVRQARRRWPRSSRTAASRAETRWR